MNQGSSKKPTLPMLMIDDLTIEGLIKYLDQGQSSVGIFSDEGGKILGGHSMSAENQLKTIAILSTCWDGKAINVVRASKPPVCIVGKRVAMHLMAQPKVADIALSNSMMVDQGFLSRVLICWPESKAGTRYYRERDPKMVKDLDEFLNGLLKIHRQPLPVKDWAPNELDPPPLPLSSGAKREFIIFHDEVESELGETGRYFPIRGFGSKAAEHAGRLAGVLTLADDFSSSEIPQRKMLAGITLARFYLEESLRLWSGAQVDEEILQAEELLKWMQQRGKYHPLVETYQKGPMSLRDAKSARSAMNILITHGWVRRLDRGMIIDGKKRNEVYELT